MCIFILCFHIKPLPSEARLTIFAQLALGRKAVISISDRLLLQASNASMFFSACVQTLHPVTPHKRPLCRRKSPAAPRLDRKTRSTSVTSVGRLPFTWQPSGEMPSKLKSSLAWELMSMSKTLQVRCCRRWSLNSFDRVCMTANIDLKITTADS